MSPLDIILVITIIVGGFVGYKERFIVSLFSLVALVLGVLGGFRLMGAIMVMMGRNYKVDESVLPYVAFGIAFVVITIVVGLLGKIVKAAVQIPWLGPLDPALGSLFGLARATFMVSILLWIIDSLKVKLPDQWNADSWLQPIISDFALKITNWISAYLPFLRASS